MAASEYSARSRFFAPPCEFDGCFTTFYHFSLVADRPITLEDYLQPEWANIRFFSGSAPECWLGEHHTSGAQFTATGPSSLPCKFHLQPVAMWGIGLLPLGWARFVDVDAQDLVNVVCDGSKHAAFAKFTAIADALADDGLTMEQQQSAIVETMRTLMQPCRDEDKIIRIHAALIDETIVSVGDFADAADLSVRSLERMCCRYFGFPPKLLMRRQRFMRSLTSFMLQPDVRWTDAMDHHYHDQAQFSREFRTFMTMNPSEYAQLDHPILSSFMEERARIWGSAAQTLDKPVR